MARVLMAAGVLFAVTLATAGPAAADCPAPTISISPSSGRGGETFQIAGRNFFKSCSDAGNVGDTNIQFRFLQGGNVFDLGSATAGTPNGDFSGTLYVPTNTTAGSATVQAFGANGSPAVPFTVTASTVASGGTTPVTSRPATTPTTAASTATTVAPAITTTVVPAPPGAATATTASTTVTTTPATTETTAVPASNNSGLNGGGLAVTIVLLVLVVLGTILASLATAGRLPLPKGRPRPRVERAAAAEAASAAAAAGAAAAVVDHEPDRFESSTAPIEPIPDPFSPVDDEPEATAPIESPVFDDEPSAAVDDEEPSAAVEDDEPSAGIDDADADADEPSAGIDDEAPASEQIAFPDDEADGKTD
ncbi:MAG TPA: hypothetical protein VFA83_17655 [Acidimicrobiales bacterium]|nr:hypothetical protein [Acidimicrobiales bacterium]